MTPQNTDRTNDACARPAMRIRTGQAACMKLKDQSRESRIRKHEQAGS
jgi:hypothetical protein